MLISIQGTELQLFHLGMVIRSNQQSTVNE